MRVPSSTPAAAHAEQIFENIREARGKIRAEAVRLSGAALLECRMAEPVVSGALLLVLQDVIGFVDFLEMMLAILVAGIAIGVPLHRELAVRRLHLRVGRGARYAENFVVVALGHQIGVLPQSQKHAPETDSEACFVSLPSP